MSTKQLALDALRIESPMPPDRLYRTLYANATEADCRRAVVSLIDDGAVRFTKDRQLEVAPAFPPPDSAALTIAPSTCACPAPHPPSARFCPRCGGAIRRPSAAMAWIRGAAARPIKMAAAMVALPFLVAPWATIFGGVFLVLETDWYHDAWRWWVRTIYPSSLKRILSQ